MSDQADRRTAAMDALTYLHDLGWSDSALANAFGVFWSTVWDWRQGYRFAPPLGMLTLAIDELKSNHSPPTGRNQSRSRGVRRPRSSSA